MKSKPWLSAFAVAMILAPVRAAETRSEVVSPEAKIWFERALGLDLGNGAEPDAVQALVAMRRAAEAGDPQAAFNVAVMLDSGRGAARNVKEAAIWYARAASRGVRRGAFNLGQLYESGDGVPANIDLSRAWYVASDLPAARERLPRLSSKASRPVHLVPPEPLFPVGNSSLEGDDPQVDLVWTSVLQPTPARFYVELRGVNADLSSEAWSGFVDVSSVRLPLPSGFRTVAWRVSVVARDPADYAISAWSTFTVPNAVTPTGASSAPSSESSDNRVKPPQAEDGDQEFDAGPRALSKQQPENTGEASSAMAQNAATGQETKRDEPVSANSPRSDRQVRETPQTSSTNRVAGVSPPSVGAANEIDRPRLSTPDVVHASPTSPAAPTVLIILAQQSVTMLADLNNKAVVIAGVKTISRADVATALSEAGARAVQLTEGTKSDIDRLVDGEVTAIVVARVTPAKAKLFPEIAGFRLLRVAVTHAN